MSDLAGATSLSTGLGALDYLLHRGEANPRTRSGIMGVELPDKTPEWGRFRDLGDDVERSDAEERRVHTNRKSSTPSSGDMRLPGSVAEIVASPPGPKIGAFFDLDGTLVAGFTGVMLTRERFRRGDMGVVELIGMIQAGLNHQLGRIEFERLITRVSTALGGRPLSEVEEIGERLFVRKVASRIYPEMRELVRAHLARGHTVVLSSSALTIQAGPVARYLGIVNTLTNVLETDSEGVLTGHLVEPILWGPGKAAAVQKFAAEHDVDLQGSYFYADGDEDVALMYLVGNPRPTNPEGKMAALARRRGWPILRFTSRGSGDIVGQLRSLVGMGSVVPVGAGAVGLGLLTRSRRRGINFFTTVFPQLALAISGVRLNVIGKENLTRVRPAVFIFNHRNRADLIIVSSLVRDNWVSVAKRELERDPVVGPLAWLLETAFIDRGDTTAAVQTLREVEDRAKKGLSVVVAPEGTRVDTDKVGPFKKGPFRIAMAAGIPIVPIVIRNAEMVAARDSVTINPGTVDAAVLPPISVADWEVDSLGERIAEVRQLYLDTLAEWPGDTLPAAGLRREPKKTTAGEATAKSGPAAQDEPAKRTAKKTPGSAAGRRNPRPGGRP